MATKPELRRVVANSYIKASDYNYNFDQLNNYIENGIADNAINNYEADREYSKGQWVLGNTSEGIGLYESQVDDNKGNSLLDTTYWEKIILGEEILEQVNEEIENRVKLDGSNAEFPYIVETYENGASWYRIYSDGWCEQGGRTEPINNTSTATISFLKSFRDSNYQVQMTGCLGGASMRSIIGTVQVFNTDFMVIYYTNTQDPTTGVLQWLARGYIV